MYKLSYKLNDGRIASISLYGLLLADAGKYPEFREQKTTAIVINPLLKGPSEKIDVMISKDENKRYYFVIFGERINVSKYLYLELSDLLDKLKRKENMPLSIFAASLIKNADKIAFIEKRWGPETVNQSGEKKYNSWAYSKEPIICIPTERKFAREEWFQTIETIPIDSEEEKMYGVARYSMPDYHLEVMRGNITIIPKEDIKKYDLNSDKSYTRKHV